MSSSKKDVIRRLYAEAFNRGDLALLETLYAEDVELHIPGLPEDPFGPEPVRRLFTMMRTAFPGLQAVVEDMVEERDKVVARVSFHDTQQNRTGTPLGLSPQETMQAWVRIEVFRVVNGRIVEQWSDRDDWTLLRQLGVVPPPAEKPKILATGVDGGRAGVRSGDGPG